MRTRLLIVVLVVGLTAITGTAFAAANFSDPAPLPRSLPGDNQLPGGEPSLAFDQSGDGHFYAVAPGGGDGKGVGFWGSADNGATWQYVRAVGSGAGGLDSDVVTAIDHSVFVADLEAASSAICKSTDFGKTFDSGCETGQAQRQAGAEEDREWLQTDPSDAKTLYFNYHDLTLEYPILEKSTDGGQSFAPCGNLVDPSQALFPSSFGNTVVGKSAVDKAGNIYVPIAAPTPSQVATSGSATPPYGEIVIAYHKGCNNDQFNNKPVYKDDSGSFANLFVSNVVGPDGTVYVLASGTLNDKDLFNTYVWTSRDGAQSFSGPFKVNQPSLTANVMSAITPGTKPGQVAVGWYGSSDTKDPNDAKATWRYYVATSGDYGQTWDQTTITANVFHYGDICTVGIACETTGGNRNLFDFSSIGVNPATGKYTTVFPGDPFDTPDREAADPAAAYIACQGGCGLPSKPGGGGGNQQVQGVSSNCHDTTAPISAISRKHSRFSRRGISLKGLATDKGCGPGGRGRVARETLAISRRVGKKCQWLRPKGGFGPTSSCRHKTYVTAKGTSKWSYALKIHLRKGIYAVAARGIDAVGNIEKPARGSRANARHNHNHYLFKVR